MVNTDIDHVVRDHAQPHSALIPWVPLSLLVGRLGLTAFDAQLSGRGEQMLHRLNEVYAKGSEPSQKLPLRGMKANLRATVESHCDECDVRDY